MGAAASVEQWPPHDRELWERKGHLVVRANGAVVDLSPLAWYEREAVSDGHVVTALRRDLVELVLDDCSSLTRALLSVVAASLDASRCPGLDDVALFLIATHCPGLRRLAARGCGRLTSVPADLAALETLDVGGCGALAEVPALGDAVFVDVSGCGTLRDVDFRGPLETLDVSGTSLAAAALSRLKRPERLRALRCASSDVADGALARLLPTCAALEALDLSGSDRLTDHGLSAVAACHGLLDLDVSGCPGLSDVGMIQRPAAVTIVASF
ncbi:F-box LRR-repeat protein [Aureococcus anophagefferens]|uniref:F-box LRR-repeat protein n=1 Tax=Aureococcus anophagefferens TaxID=44056 RepID=A0ABR1G9M7_AURAN